MTDVDLILTIITPALIMKFVKKLIKLQLIYTILFLILFAASPVPAKEPETLFAKAQELANNGSFLEAVSLYREISISSDNPDSRARALLFIGSIYDDDLDQQDAAVTCFRDLIRLYPKSPSASDALFNTGQIYYKTGRYTEAKRVFEEYVKQYPKGIRIQSAIAGADNSEKKISGEPEKPVVSKDLAPLSSKIRVLIIKNETKIVLNGSSKITVRDFRTGAVLYDGATPATFTKNGKSIHINSKSISSDAVAVSSPNNCISVGSQRYRGKMTVHLKPGGLIAVNHLDIESYLYGVVPKEMPSQWSPDALMAQAIASRTYALYVREKEAVSSKKDYDLEATINSQVYGGINGEKEQTRLAVDKTRGMVMTYKSKLVIAYFHSNSGGCTESAQNVWGVDIPYLKSVDDSFSSLQSDTMWEYTISYKDLFSLFKNIKPGLGLIERIEPGSKTPSGRNEIFTLISEKKQLKISGNTFRLTLGPFNLKSTIFKIIPNKDDVTFKGIGFGHGVGMSQWGANRMGQAGYTYADILKHYYTGVTLTEVRYI